MDYFLLPETPPVVGFDGVVRDDGAWIPADPANRDWLEYQEWLAAGNEPKPYEARDAA